MEKSKLLEEFVKLKRLIKDYENKQATTSTRVKLNEKKVIKNHLPREGNKSTIFLNPKKLNAAHNDSMLKVPVKVPNHDTGTSKLVAKVFINPNFKKQEALSSTPSMSSSNREEKQKQLRNYINETQISFPHEHNSVKKLYSNSLLSQQQHSSSNDGCGSPKLPTENKSLTSKNRVIFINPQFSSSSKLGVGLNDSSLQSIKRKNTTSGAEHCNQSLGSEIKADHQKSAVHICRKRKVLLNGDKLTRSSTSDQKRRNGIENIIETANKIFVNPKFEKKGSDSASGGKTSNLKLNCNLISPTNSSAQTLVTKGTSTIPVLLCGKEVPNKFTSVSYPLCAIVGLDRGKQIARKKITQRSRTCSTSLVTLSTTKLVCKRKLSQKVAETSAKASSQPLFVSKTKLVRNVVKRTNSSCIAKVKVKQLIQKPQAQVLSAEKIYKLRRKSSADSSLNMISVVPRPVIVTKVRSKNGKSLKLIRKSADTSLSSTIAGKLKAQTIMNRKMELRQQASKIAMCLFQNRLKRNHFSKINIPVKVSQTQSYNKNIYKKNNIRKPLTKAALVGKKEATIVIPKTQARNNPLDMTKFIKSKYRLIRKQSSVISRYKLCQKIVHKTIPHNKLVQRKKLKWKRKMATPKRRLTRKDLSIKKIGGVFYQYSRTTLAKNKPSCKQVPQLQSKGVYKYTSERRQNRFCLNKNPGRKQVGIRGVSFITSPSGMSWKRTNNCSARSILTQAKQKSIYLLSKKMKKNNEPCLFIHRYGRCSGNERGTCVRLHDKKYVAVCKKFIQGSCSDAQCRLSHLPSCHNMPTCHHFLAGQCGRDHCPYPHIKVSDSAPICLDFLKGFCSLGDQCAKRHFEICPSFEKGICARGKYCPYPHPKNKMGENLKGKFKHIKRKPQPPKETESVSTHNLRYFEDVNLQKENQITLDEDQEKSEDGDSEVEVEEVTCLKKRPKLGELPSFIPLSHSFQVEDT